jgi:CHAD domain-containing protein
MAYRFKKQEAIPNAIRRIFAEEVTYAVGQLSNSSNRTEAVHEARKSVKKIRGLLSLIQSRLGREFKTEDRYFAKAGKHLSKARDSAVILQAFDELVQGCPELAVAAASDVRRNLQRHLLETRAEQDVSSHVASLLHDAKPRAVAWPVDGLDLDGILPDVMETYRRGRRALKRALHSQSPEALHSLRKKAKQHWYHLRLLEVVWDAELRRHAKSLRDLETLLGDERNLAMLRSQLAQEAETARDRQHLREFIVLIDQQSSTLRKQALEIAERLYAGKTRAFGEKLSALWRTSPKPPAVQVRLAKPAVA